ncbi:MAG: hypothetical protein Q8R91_08400 [Candidatus Omnitrophota bacterium]|nr:hypothetical protein [Candidatus Omnitrophota bacterium]
MNKRVGLVIVLAIALIFLAKNVIVRFAVTSGVKALTGLRLSIRDIDVGWLNTRLGVTGLRVLNPTGFHDAVMVDVPELYIDYDLGAFLKGQTHLEEIRLDLQELTVIKNEQGDVNLNALRTVKASKEPRPPQPAPKDTTIASKPPQIQVDLFELHIGTVVYKDYSVSPPQVHTFPVNVHERFEHITHPQALAGLIITRALAKTTIAQLTHLDLKALQEGLTDLVGKSLQKAVGEVGQGALDVTGQAVQGTTGALKKLLGQ